MKTFFKKINNNYPSINKIETLLDLKIKTNKNININKKYLDLNIRRKKLINITFLVKTNEFNKFTLNGIIDKKKKKSNTNGTVTSKSLLSGVYVKMNFHLHSPVIRLA